MCFQKAATSMDTTQAPSLYLLNSTPQGWRCACGVAGRSSSNLLLELLFGWLFAFGPAEFRPRDETVLVLILIVHQAVR